MHIVENNLLNYVMHYILAFHSKLDLEKDANETLKDELGTCSQDGMRPIVKAIVWDRNDHLL